MINNPVEILATGKWDRLLRTKLPSAATDLVLIKARRGTALEVAVFDYHCTGITVAPTAGAVYVNVATPSLICISATSLGGGAYTVRFSSAGGILAASGTITKTSGTGDASITFASVTEPQPFAGVIYQPTESTGRFWARHYLASYAHLNEASGCTRIMRSTFAELYPKNAVVPTDTGSGQDGNLTSGTQAQAPTTIIEANAGSGRSESGSGWANYSSGAQVPVTRYVAAAAGTNIVTYTITGCSRILWRFFQSTNGGKIAVTITESGVEISAAQYLAGPQSGTRYISQLYSLASFSNSKIAYAPLAKGLDHTKTYVVTLTWAAGGSTRFYDSGLLGYYDATNDRDGFPYNLIGRTGQWDRYTTFTTTQRALFAGSRYVYQTSSCTRVDVVYLKVVNGGFLGVKIYDATGTEIDSGSYQNLTTHANGDRYLNTYNAGATQFTVTVATGLPEASYYVHIYTLPDSASGFTETSGNGGGSSRYAVVDSGIQTYNTEDGGEYGVDAFIDGYKEWTGGALSYLDAAGNFVFAGQARDSGDANFSALSENGYTSGTHGCESYPDDLVVSVDGTPIDWAGAADGDDWTGGEISISFTTQIGTKTNPTTYWADAEYEYVFTRFGIKTTFTITTTREIYTGTWYTGMLIAPNSSAAGGTLLGTGFDNLYLEPALNQTVVPESPQVVTSTTRTHRGACFYTDEGHAILLEQVNPGEIWEEYTGANNATAVSERDVTAKTYAIVKNDATGGAAGTALAPGYTNTWVSNLRMIYEPGIAAILSA